MRGFVRDRLARDVMLVAIVGDITPAQLKPLLDDTFGDLPAHAAPGTVPPLEPRAAGETLVAKLPIPQSVVVFGQPGLKRDDPDWYAALLVNDILGGGGFSARLTQEVREKRGLAYSVYSALEPMDQGGVIIGGVGTENARVGQSIALVRSEWQRMRDEGPTAPELAADKTYLTGSFPLSLDSTGRIAATLSTSCATGSASTISTGATPSSDGVTLDDAKRVAKRLLDPDALTFVVVGSPPSSPDRVTNLGQSYQSLSLRLCITTGASKNEGFLSLVFRFLRLPTFEQQFSQSCLTDRRLKPRHSGHVRWLSLAYTLVRLHQDCSVSP